MKRSLVVLALFVASATAAVRLYDVPPFRNLIGSVSGLPSYGASQSLRMTADSLTRISILVGERGQTQRHV